MASRSYRSGDVAALMSFSRESCYWPGCDVPKIRFVEKQPFLQVEIAHIRGLKDDSARHDKSMTNEERNAWTNLLLLCVAHHKAVDRDEEKYTVELLHEWKRMAEREGSVLEGVIGLDDQRLDAMIQDAFGQYVERLDQAVSRLETLDRDAAEAAALLRPLVDELAATQLSRPVLNEDTVGSLAESSQRLRSLETTVEHLGAAADRLQGLPGWIEQLNGANKDLGGHIRNLTGNM